MRKITVVTQDGSSVELTQGQKAYADAKAELPVGSSLISAAEKAYPNANRDTLRQIVNRNEKNDKIAAYSASQLIEAKNTVLEVMRDSKGKARDRLAAAFDVQDRTTGKAIQKTEVMSTTLSIGIDLSGFTEDNV